MDHELKQRLVGAVVVTALAAIFIPMLFDDPIDNSAKTVSEMTVPPEPTIKSSEADNLPENKAEILNNSEPDLKVSEVDDNQMNATNSGQQIVPIDKNLTAKTEAVIAGTDTAENQQIDQTSSQIQSGDTSPLDTGDVVPPEEEGEDIAAPQSKVKKPAQKHDESATKKEATTKSSVIKNNPTAEVATEKNKDTASKLNKDSATKSSSKLVRWSLQAGSYSKKENAQAALEKLRKQGFPATMIAKGNLYRIKIGPELDKKKAVEIKSKLASQKIQSYLQSE